jgi:hypothetical protein
MRKGGRGANAEMKEAFQMVPNAINTALPTLRSLEPLLQHIRRARLGDLSLL